ncbi:MAG: phosphomannomutase, partial [Candidatus Krumholzibacteria bacterium]|nr:phosphomannomutase [Candidatus Krumholzibacteria bacterium]
MFREYDIRGVVGVDLTEERVRRLGLAVAATFVRENIREAVVGRDVRPSSDSFFGALSEGLTSGGVSVIDVGVVPTPVFYFAAKRWGIRGGVMITASHNPSEFNGFKVLRGEGTIYGADILELRNVALESLPEPGGGRVTARTADSEYIDYVTANVTLAGPVSFAVDGGN